MAILNTNETMFTAFEPKLQNRFLMFIDGIAAYLIKTSSDIHICRIKKAPKIGAFLLYKLTFSNSRWRNPLL